MQVSGINSNYTNRPVFQARVPQDIQNTVLREAVDLGTEGLKRAKAQIAKVQSWGRPDSTLDLTFDSTRNRLMLGMNNFAISKNYGAALGKDTDNFVDAFMDLTEKDIQKAEKKIADEVEICKNDLINKAKSSGSLSKKITGTENPTENQLRAAVDKLPEDKMIELRFNLDDPSKFSQGPILNFKI